MTSRFLRKELGAVTTAPLSPESTQNPIWQQELEALASRLAVSAETKFAVRKGEVTIQHLDAVEGTPTRRIVRLNSAGVPPLVLELTVNLHGQVYIHFPHEEEVAIWCKHVGTHPLDLQIALQQLCELVGKLWGETSTR